MTITKFVKLATLSLSEVNLISEYAGPLFLVPSWCVLLSLSPELPSVSLLQKTPSSPVSCHATGFYPDRVMVFWSRDGEELHEDVEHGELLSNPDGTFQMSVDLDLSVVKPDDWSRYTCVFQLSGVEHDIVTKLDPSVIKTNWGK